MIIFSFGVTAFGVTAFVNVFFCNLSHEVSLRKGHGFMVCFLCIFCVLICLMKENSVLVWTA